MTNDITQATFGEAYQQMKAYPAAGPRDAHDGVPSRPTLGRYAMQEVMEEHFDEEVFTDSPLHSETNDVLACIIKAVNEDDRSIGEIKAAAREGDGRASDELREQANAALDARYPSWDGELSGSLNFSAPVLAAIAAASFDVDPLEAVRERLGDAAALEDGEDEEEVEQEEDESEEEVEA